MDTRHQKVLIIDDEVALLETAALRLKASGYAVASASTGKKGLKLANTFKPDIIFMDIILPDMDGWEVCRQCRLNPELKKTRIAVITAANIEDITKKVLAAHVEGVILKPFEANALTDFIEQKNVLTQRESHPKTKHSEEPATRKHIHT